jgi:DNA-binding NarL/FixJ family response regulator
MRSPPWILVVDDDPVNLDVAAARLAAHGYNILTAANGEQALEIAREQHPDLILLDIVMPGLDGLEVCRRLKADQSASFTPIIMLTAKVDAGDIVAGLEAGGDEYLAKPVDPSALVARVRSMLRTKALYDTVREQAERLQAQTSQLDEWNRTLEQRVTDQVAEIERVSRLKRFLPPQIAELIISSGDEILESHRREITVVFCDLRGFTAFSETAAPEEVMEILAQFHAAMGDLVFRFEGTLGRFGGDGLMVFFNDPLTCPDPAARAVRMAVAMREHTVELAKGWRKRGHDLGFGAGIAMGYATLGPIRAGDQSHYGAIGMATNLASLLCDEATAGQILIGQRVCAAVDKIVETETIGELQVRGFHKPVFVYNVRGLKDSAPASGRSSGGLSKRETEVAGLVARGLSNRDIAQTLYLSERTVESHVQSILNKLGFRTRTQIAAWAVGQGVGTVRENDGNTGPTTP